MQYTPNLKLPQYEDNDVTSYLTTYNETMGLIDTAVAKNSTDIAKNTTDLSGLESQVTTLQDEVTTNTADISALETTVSGHASRLNGIDQSITALQTTDASLQTQIDSTADVAGQVYGGILTANETTLAIPIGEFDENTLVDVYTSIYGVNPLTIELRGATGGQPNVCVTTWDTQASDMKVTVVTRKGVEL